jgi:hypothetical protein
MAAISKDPPKLNADERAAKAEAGAREIGRHGSQGAAVQKLERNSLQKRAYAIRVGWAWRPARNGPLPGFGPYQNPSEINARKIGEFVEIVVSAR